MKGTTEGIPLKKVPYHALEYRRYNPVMGYCPSRDLYVYYDEEIQKESDDREGVEIPFAIITRVDKSAAEIENIDIERDTVLDYDCRHSTTGMFEVYSRKMGWDIKGFKIFHIWNISRNDNKPHSPLPCSAKFKKGVNEVEIEIDGDEGMKDVVSFTLDLQDCDRPLCKKVGDWEVKYSLFSNARRVKLEIIPYSASASAGGESTLDVTGHVSVYFDHKGDSYERELFRMGGAEKPENAYEGLPLRTSPVLILPCRSKAFTLGVSLTDSCGKFMVESSVLVRHRSVAIDQQQYLFGHPGYIVLRAFWGCLCVKQGVCTCPCGTAIGFKDGSHEDQASSSSTSQETSSDDDSSSSSTSQETSSDQDGKM